MGQQRFFWLEALVRWHNLGRGRPKFGAESSASACLYCNTSRWPRNVAATITMVSPPEGSAEPLTDEQLAPRICHILLVACHKDPVDPGAARLVRLLYQMGSDEEAVTWLHKLREEHSPGHPEGAQIRQRLLLQT